MLNPVSAVAFAAGLTVTETTFEGEVQAPLVAIALYQVVGVAAAYTKLPVANEELVTVADNGINVHTGVALVAFTKLVDLYQATVPVDSPKENKDETEDPDGRDPTHTF